LSLNALHTETVDKVQTKDVQRDSCRYLCEKPQMREEMMEKLQDAIQIAGILWEQ